MRRMIAFPCGGETLAGTLDLPPGGSRTGVLIVSGGNEIRIGAHRGMALLAQQLADAGLAVFRYDRRGIGDSTGDNRGFLASADDLAAAARAFRSEAPEVERLVAFGNCDAATALALYHQAADIDALILANPWPGAEPDALPPAPAITAHYAEQIRQPRQWLRLFTGQVSIAKLFGGLSKIFRSKIDVESQEDPTTSPGREVPPNRPERYAGRIAAGIAATGTPTTILLAERDNTAIAFRTDWQALGEAPPCPTFSLDSGSHSFATAADKAWLLQQVIAVAGPGHAGSDGTMA